MKPVPACLWSTWAEGFVLLLECKEMDNDVGGRSAGSNMWAGELCCLCVELNVQDIMRRRNYIGIGCSCL